MKLTRGFTIVELMVVIAVIAILISILLPGMGRALDSARMTGCMSNLKQQGVAWKAYSVDNSHQLASAEQSFASAWVRKLATEPGHETLEDLQAGVLWDYHQTAEVYRCPEENRKASDGVAYIRSYSISGYLNGRYGGQSMGQSTATTTDDIARPSDTLLMVDEADPRNYVRGGFLIHPHGKPGRKWQWIDWTAHFHFNGFPHSLADGSAVFRRYEDGRTPQITRFHRRHPNSKDWAYVADRYDPGQTHNP